jgi:hypothetical protein
MTATEQVDGGLGTGAHEQRERAEQLILRQRRGVAVAGGDQRGGKVIAGPLALFRGQFTEELREAGEGGSELSWFRVGAE